MLGLLVVGDALSAAPLDEDAMARVQQGWKLLDYVATDYAVAVADGAVVDAAEYAEQQEFSAHVASILAALPARAGREALQQQAHGLQAAIDALESPAEVARRAHALGAALLAAYPVPTAPTRPPDPARGAALYAQHCAACHGAHGRGDGPAAQGLDPAPIDFTDAARADLRSPLSLYQATTQGIEGTSMAGYADVLDDAERWALAYYVGTLAYADGAKAGEALWTGDPALRARASSLADLSQLRVGQLDGTLGLEEARAAVGWLRAHPGAVAAAPQGLTLARARLAASLAAARAGERNEAVRLALAAYLDGVEPVEPRLDARDRPLRVQIETAMGSYRMALARNQPVADVEALAATADQLLARAVEVLDSGSGTRGAVFAAAFVILLREGVEALLVIIALLAFLGRTAQIQARRHVHLGWVLALVAGGLTWFAARHLIDISGASRELTEGLSALFAAAVLVLVGLWMHHKSMGQHWQAWLKRQMDNALSRRSAWFLFLLAFISVYREVFETILFYIALWGDGQHLWMLAGMLCAVVALAVIAWVMLRTSRRLPLRQFFLASSALMAVLAVIFAGKGVAALQEAGWVQLSHVPVPRIDWLGIYPTWQTLAAQLLAVAALLAGWLWNRRHA